MKISTVRSAIICGLVAAAAIAPAGVASATDHELSVVNVASTFAPYRAGSIASTYAPQLVPVGSRVVVSSLSRDTSTIMLGVQGLVPNREYGAHIHQKPCGALPTDAGPHFQNVTDPVQPSVDPAYANPTNEVWLDFTTDALGSGIAVARQGWEFDSRSAKSLVIHESHTHTGEGHAGMAGDRLACVSANF